MLELGVKTLIAYLLGALLGSLVLGRLRGVDIRRLGSGNAGATNALRTQGKAVRSVGLAHRSRQGRIRGAVLAGGGTSGGRHRSWICRANG